MAKGKHPAPFRTWKLSPSAPMVLRPGGRGRVGRRRTFTLLRATSRGGPWHLSGQGSTEIASTHQESSWHRPHTRPALIAETAAETVAAGRPAAGDVRSRAAVAGPGATTPASVRAAPVRAPSAVSVATTGQAARPAEDPRPDVGHAGTTQAVAERSGTTRAGAEHAGTTQEAVALGGTVPARAVLVRAGLVRAGLGERPAGVGTGGRTPDQGHNATTQRSPMASPGPSWTGR